MNTQLSQSKHYLIGKMLVENGLISHENLKACLQEQAANNLKLGEILIKKKLITYAQLDTFLAEQSILNASAEAADQLSSAAHYQLQKLLLQPHLAGLDPLRLETASEVIDQKLTYLFAQDIVRLERLLALHQDYRFDSEDAQPILAELERQIFTLLNIPIPDLEIERPISENSILLGDLLLRKQIITKAQLNAALTQQQETKQRLGQILIQRKLLTFAQLDQLLWEQTSPPELPA